MKVNLNLDLTIPQDYQDEWRALHKLDPTPENIHRMVLAFCEALDWRIVGPNANFQREYPNSPTLEQSP